MLHGAPVYWHKAGIPVLLSAIASLDTVDLDERRDYLTIRISDGAGWSWRCPSRWGGRRGSQPSLGIIWPIRRRDSRIENAPALCSSPLRSSLVSDDLLNRHRRGCAVDVRVPRSQPS